MTSNELKDRLLAELKKAKYGASTRNLCNLLFKKDCGTYIVIPGDHRMKQVYIHLKSLQKQGKIINPEPGHWKFVHSND